MLDEKNISSPKDLELTQEDLKFAVEYDANHDLQDAYMQRDAQIWANEYLKKISSQF